MEIGSVLSTFFSLGPWSYDEFVTESIFWKPIFKQIYFYIPAIFTTLGKASEIFIEVSHKVQLRIIKFQLFLQTFFLTHSACLTA